MNRTALTVVLVILLLASLGSNTFLYLNKMKSDKELENKVAVMKAKDSLQMELNRMEDSLNLVIQTFQNENQTLGEGGRAEPERGDRAPVAGIGVAAAQPAAGADDEIRAIAGGGLPVRVRHAR